MKPHEENWRFSGGDKYPCIETDEADAKLVADFEGQGAVPVARARLAACAPEMARAMLRALKEEGRPCAVKDQCWTCEIERVLRDAGVIS